MQMGLNLSWLPTFEVRTRSGRLGSHYAVPGAAVVGAYCTVDQNAWLLSSQPLHQFSP